MAVKTGFTVISGLSSVICQTLFQPKLTPAKCRRNVDNFLEACRKIGVHRVSLYNLFKGE